MAAKALSIKGYARWVTRGRLVQVISRYDPQSALFRIVEATRNALTNITGQSAQRREKPARSKQVTFAVMVTSLRPSSMNRLFTSLVLAYGLTGSASTNSANWRSRALTAPLRQLSAIDSDTGSGKMSSSPFSIPSKMARATDSGEAFGTSKPRLMSVSTGPARTAWTLTPRPPKERGAIVTGRTRPPLRSSRPERSATRPRPPPTER